MDVFISYAREDAAIADRLYQDLIGVRGITPWLDSKKLLPGVHWKLEIMEAVKRCDLFVVLLSNRSVSKKGFVQHEVKEALDKLKSYTPDNIFIIPARIEECIPRHPELHDINWVDLFPSWKDGVKLILQAINQQMKKQVSIPSITDKIVIETINSQEIFERRISDRGELCGCDSMELRFQECSFKGALQGSNFVRCKFNSCDFSDTMLRGVNFEGAKFINCTMAGADLWGVNFWGADIRGIKDFQLARLEQTNFFLTRFSKKHEKLCRSTGAISLGDYGSFVEHFRDVIGMNENEISSTFVWLNQRYFRQMFGKNSTAVSNKESRLAHILSRIEDK